MEKDLEARLKGEAQAALNELFLEGKLQSLMTAYRVVDDAWDRNFYKIEFWNDWLPSVTLLWEDKQTPFGEVVKQAVVRELKRRAGQ